VRASSSWTTSGLLAALPEDLRPLIEVASIDGWRIRSELLPLQWSHVDLRKGVMRLDAGTTKNGAAREFKFQSLPRVVAILHQQWEAKKTLEKAQERTIQHVFHRNGEPIKDFRRAWDGAVERIGFPGKVPHDLRRSAIRQLVRAGVTEKVAMGISGHKTRDVFDRYNITIDDDLRDAAMMLAAHHDREAGGSRRFCRWLRLRAGRKSEPGSATGG
jgi:integrase